MSEKTIRGIVPALAIAAILCGIYLRFHGIGDRGLWGSDTIYYTNIARSWSQGDLVYQIGERSPSFRPVVFGLYAVAIRVLGYHDFTIKLLNAGLDTINVVLIFLSCYLLSNRKAWPALAAALFYSLLPFAIYQCRTELTHILSATMVLTSWVFLLAFLRGDPRTPGYVCLGLAGAFVGLGALVHEDLILIAVGYSLYLLFDFVLSRRWSTLEIRRFTAQMSIFTAGVLAISFKVIVSSWQVVRKAAPEASETEESWRFPSYLEQVARFAWNSVSGLSSIVVAFLFALLLVSMSAFVVIKAVRRESSWPGMCRLSYLPIVVVFTYLGIYCFFFEAFFIRLLLPLFPFCFVPLIVWLSQCFRARLPGTLSRASVLIVALSLGFLNLENFHEHRSFRSATYFDRWATISRPPKPNPTKALREFHKMAYKKTWARAVYDEMKDRVTEENKILVTSSIMYPYPGRRSLQVGYYFGDDAVYAIDHDEPLDELIDTFKIRYVLFSSFRADRRVLDWKSYERYLYGGRWSSREPITLGASYGFEPGRYSLRKEYEFLMAYLDARGARVIYTTGFFAQGQGHRSVEVWGDSTVIYDLLVEEQASSWKAQSSAELARFSESQDSVVLASPSPSWARLAMATSASPSRVTRKKR